MIKMRKKMLLFLAICFLLLAQSLLKVCYTSVTASSSTSWTITIWQSGCNAKSEGWLSRGGDKISDSWGRPDDWLTCYSNSASEHILAYGIPDEAWYYIGFDWDMDGEFEQMLHDIVPVIDGTHFSKTYTHSPETVTIEGEGGSVGGMWVPIDKFGLLAPYIGLASTILVATVATSIYAKHIKPKKEKQ